MSLQVRVEQAIALSVAGAQKTNFGQYIGGKFWDKKPVQQFFLSSFFICSQNVTFRVLSRIQFQGGGVVTQNQGVPSLPSPSPHLPRPPPPPPFHPLHSPPLRSRAL